MKTLISFCMVLMMMLVACNKDQFVQEEDLMLKKAKVPVPMKADFCATPDLTSTPMLIPIPGLDPNDPNSWLPSKMFVSGQATHMGNVITEKSICEVKTLELVIEGTSPENFKYFLLQKGIGIMTAANGDNYPITWWGKTSLADWTYIGEVTMFSGTGKFKGASGVVNMIGAVDRVAGTNCWKADGYMEYLR
ncbi:MAG: hypothetical protein Q8S54_09580 [Bacteroidota bacterium]|nr:hypothetical protein [Odoribacter sp.]MDP3643424.1 hypothetical protein [Bacteroidota bacterium]